MLLFKKICALIILAAVFFTPAGFAQSDTVRIKGAAEANYLTFCGNRTAWPQAPLEGEVFYNSSEKTIKYFDGINWRSITGGAASSSKSIANLVVAASDTPDKDSRANYVCTGTNDQVFIQQAIDALGAKGGTIYLLEGTYNISSPIRLNNTAPNDSGKSIIGSGRNTKLKLLNGNRLLEVSDVSGVNISRLSVEGLHAAVSVTGGIVFIGVTDSSIEDVWVGGISSLNGSAGIFLDGTSNNNTISGCHLQENPRQISIAGSSNIITGNTFNTCNQEDIWVTSLNTSGDRNMIYENNMTGGGDHGIYLEYTHENIILNNNIDKERHGLYLAASPYNIINDNGINNISYSGTGVGINFNGSGHNIISGNNLNSNDTGMDFLVTSNSNIVSSNLISGDKASAGNSSSVKVRSYFNLFQGNRIFSTVAATGDTYGISIKDMDKPAMVNYQNYLAGNFISGSRYEVKIRDEAGNNTRYTGQDKITLEKNQIDITSGSTYALNFAQPKSFVVFNVTSSSDVTVTLGAPQAAGAILILENISAARKIKINESSVVQLEGGSRELDKGDTLMLIWDAALTPKRWTQLGYAANN